MFHTLLSGLDAQTISRSLGASSSFHTLLSRLNAQTHPQPEIPNGPA